jgi:hypothetical protein
VLERLNQELKRRTNVVRIFPHEASCLRLVRALAVEIHEEWAEGPRYLDLSVLPTGAGCIARLAEAAWIRKQKQKTEVTKDQKDHPQANPLLQNLTHTTPTT